eukprot:SAG22_NODE_8495_length_651_cov_1.057971_1_plen_97_part_01
MAVARLQPALRHAVDKLVLNDPSVTVSPESSNALGMGFRCGFLGKLHMEVFHQRLGDEFDQDVLATAPMVPFEADAPVEGGGEQAAARQAALSLADR